MYSVGGLRELSKWYVVKCTQDQTYWWEIRRDVQLFWCIKYTIKFENRLHSQEIYAIQACNTANGSEMDLVVEMVDIN